MSARRTRSTTTPASASASAKKLKKKPQKKVKENEKQKPLRPENKHSYLDSRSRAKLPILRSTMEPLLVVIQEALAQHVNFKIKRELS